MKKRLGKLAIAVGAVVCLVLLATLPAHARAPRQCFSCGCYGCAGPFAATVLVGPDKGLRLAGDMKLHPQGTEGQLVGTLKPPTGATIKVTGQAYGAAINLFIHLGPGKNIFGSGIMGVDPDQKRTLLGGTFSGPRDGDLGSWAKRE